MRGRGIKNAAAGGGASRIYLSRVCLRVCRRLGGAQVRSTAEAKNGSEQVVSIRTAKAKARVESEFVRAQKPQRVQRNGTEDTLSAKAPGRSAEARILE